jgi:DNA-binding response OmpR family regulator
MLPDGAGIDWLKELRLRDAATPVVMLTARAELLDKVLGLELGANDYLTKPFEPRELVARIRVQLRHRAPPERERIEFSGVAVDVKSREAFLDGSPVELTKTEFDLLKLFLESPNQVFARNELLERVWGYESYPSTRTVDTHILQLRQKLGAELFETVHGVGYRMRARA